MGPITHLTQELPSSAAIKWKAKLYSGAPGQISLIEGEIVEEVKPAVNGWMTVRNTNGEEGPVPITHLTQESASTATIKWKAKLYCGAQGQISLVEGEIVEELKPAVN